MNYNISLKKSAFEKIDMANIFSFIIENNAVETFKLATHASFHYYKNKTTNINEVEERRPVRTLDSFKEDELCLTVKDSKLGVHVANFISKNKNIIYLNKDEASYDIERTWRIIQEKKDLTKIKKLYLHLESWSKMAYAYRAFMSYTIEIEDITY